MRLVRYWLLGKTLVSLDVCNKGKNLYILHKCVIKIYTNFLKIIISKELWIHEVSGLGNMTNFVNLV
jgi:hypothetical protein